MPVMFSGCYVLFICEGTAEKVILSKLLDAGVLNIPQYKEIHAFVWGKLCLQGLRKQAPRSP